VRCSASAVARHLLWRSRAALRRSLCHRCSVARSTHCGRSTSVVFVATHALQAAEGHEYLRCPEALTGPRDLTSAHRRCKQQPPPPRFQWAGRRCARLKRRAGRPTISLRSRSGPEGRVSNCLSGLVSSLASTVSSYCM
jgi:hypothetical protein